MQAALRERAAGSIAVVFDLDDTLLDRERWSLDRFRHVAIDLGMNSVEQDAFLQVCREKMTGRKWTGLVEDIASATCVPFSALQESYSRQVGTDAAVVAHSRECVRLLREAGVSVGVLSNNSSWENVQNKLTVFGVPFDAVVAVWHEQRKPAADGFLQIAEQLDVPISDVVMVGDDGTRDIVGALSAGCQKAIHVALPNGRRDRSYRSSLSVEQLTRCVEVSSLRELHAALW
jgi:HAD superfamily hydrolase (TIGR01662 family)